MVDTGLLPRQVQDSGHQVLKDAASQEHSCRWAQAVGRLTLSQEAVPRLTGNCSSALVDGERSVSYCDGSSGGVFSGDMVSAGRCLYQPRLMILLAGASQMPVSFWWLCPLARVSYCSGSCLCDSSGFVMSSVATGPWIRTGLEMADGKSGLSVEKTIS